MRTLIDIPDKQIKDLTAICEAEKVSRAEVIRQAISFTSKRKNLKGLKCLVCGRIARWMG